MHTPPPPSRARRAIAVFAIALGSAVVVGVFAIATYIEAWLSAPAQPPVAADVIVSLGGDPGSRVAYALSLYQRGFAPRILLMTADGSGRDNPAPYPDLRGNFLIANGVPSHAIYYEVAPQSTCDEAIAARAWMRACGWRSALVVSDAVHMRRVAWTWQQSFDSTGLSFRPTAAPSRDNNNPENQRSELQKNLFYRARYAADACARDATCTGNLPLSIACRP